MSPHRVRDLGSRFSVVIDGVDDATLRRRVNPETWSPLEYMCHVRDVFLIQRDRAVLALIEDRPSYPRMYREERVDVVRYGEESPGQAGHQQLGVAAEMVVWAFSERTRREWQRPLFTALPSPLNVTSPGWRNTPFTRANTTCSTSIAFSPREFATPNPRSGAGWGLG